MTVFPSYRRLSSKAKGQPSPQPQFLPSQSQGNLYSSQTSCRRSTSGIIGSNYAGRSTRTSCPTLQQVLCQDHRQTAMMPTSTSASVCVKKVGGKAIHHRGHSAGNPQPAKTRSSQRADFSRTSNERCFVGELSSICDAIYDCDPDPELRFLKQRPCLWGHRITVSGFSLCY